MTTAVTMPASLMTGCPRLSPGSRVVGSGRNVPVVKSSVRRARWNESRSLTFAARSRGTALARTSPVAPSAMEMLL